jgi:hypothetical protein
MTTTNGGGGGGIARSRDWRGWWLRLSLSSSRGSSRGVGWSDCVYNKSVAKENSGLVRIPP